MIKINPGPSLAQDKLSELIETPESESTQSIKAHIISKDMKHLESYLMNISNSNVQALPKLSSSLCKLVASKNKIKDISFTFLIGSLKYIDLSDNYITQINSFEFSKVPNLETLNIKNNKLRILKTIPQLKEYTATGNPIQKLESDICKHGIIELQFDWMLYTISKIKPGNDFKTSTKKLKQKLCKMQDRLLSLLEFLQVIDENSLFATNTEQHINFAITKNHQDFFLHLQSYYPELKIEEEIYQGKPSLFQLSLLHDCDKAVQYLMQNEILKNGKVDYMHIACRYNNSKAFQKLLQKGFSINSYDSKSNSLIHELISNFSVQLSPPILMKVLKGHYNPNHINHRKLNPMLYSGNVCLQSLIRFIKYIQSNKHILFLFDFDQICGCNYSENILHLGVRLINFELVKLIVHNKLVNPFILNSMMKRPKQIPTLLIIKKTICKYQQTTFRILLSNRSKIKRTMQTYNQQQDFSQMIQRKKQKDQYCFFHSLLSSNPSQKSLVISKVMNSLDRLQVNFFTTKQIFINSFLGSGNSTRCQLEQFLEEEMRVSIEKSQVGCYQQYNTFQNMLSASVFQQSGRVSQSIDFQIILKLQGKVSQQGRGRMEPKVLVTKQSKMKRSKSQRLQMIGNGCINISI